MSYPPQHRLDQPADAGAVIERTVILHYTDDAGTEDRATLESDPSADIGERCSSGQGTGPCPDTSLDSYIVLESDKLNRAWRRIRS